MAAPIPAPPAAAPARPYRPYLAPLLLRATGALGDAAAADWLADAVFNAIGLIGMNGGAASRVAVAPAAAQLDGALWVATLTYTQTSTPSWALAGAPADISNHLVVVAVKGDRAAVCGSDTSIYRALTRAVAAEFQPLEQATMEGAFVGVEAKAIWMSGVHAPTAVKPSAKTLMGSALEYALDPLGDQTFYYSAMRSRVTYSVAGKPVEKVVGVAPGQARLWINRPATWPDFLSDLEALIDHAAAGHIRPNLYDGLAQTVPDFTGVGDPYDVVVMPPELLSENDVSDALREAAVRWAYEVKLEVIATAPGPSLTLKAMWQGLELGELRLQIQPGGEEHAMEGDWTHAPVDAAAASAAQQRDMRTAGLELLVERRWLRVYFENGHVWAQGRLYLPRFRDMVFKYEPRDFTGYTVDQEKPAHDKHHPLISCIAANDMHGAKDTSLFAYVVEKMFLQAGQPNGWLASDDGSMEFADFVHIDPVAKVVTLVHVKAANKSAAAREVSVSAFEVVVGQAIKNLRHLDHVALADALHKGRHKKIARAVWRDGVRQPNRAGIIRAAKALGANYQRRLVVLQPQLTQLERQACEGLAGAPPAATLSRQERKKLLDTLLNGARAVALSVSAEFECCEAV